MVLETDVKLCVTGPDFPEKNFLPKKLGKWIKNGPKTWFLAFIEILSLIFTEFVL